MEAKKQKLILEYLLSSPDVFLLCNGIVKPEYFAPELKATVKFVQGYYESFKGLPDPEQIEAETDLSVRLHELDSAKTQFCTLEIEKFCKRQAVQQAIMRASKVVNKENYGPEEEMAVEEMIREAVTISLHRDIGLDYFENPRERLQRQLTHFKPIPTLWAEFDEALFGGLNRDELLLVSANSGGGKSITLANLALNFCIQGFHVAYISLELSEDLIGRRFDTMISGISSAIWRDHVDEIADKVTAWGSDKGSIVVKYMPSGSTALNIRAYLKEYELRYRRVPDLLVVDYLDLMGSIAKVSADNVFEKDKQASEQLRNILVEYHMVGASASQQNRGAIEADVLNQGHIAGGISKVNTTDVYASVILTDAMKAAGEIGFCFLKTRNSDGVGKTVYSGWNNKTLRIADDERQQEEDDDTAIFAARKPKEKEGGRLTGGLPPKSSMNLLDIMQ